MKPPGSSMSRLIVSSPETFGLELDFVGLLSLSMLTKVSSAQNPLHTFPRSFPVDGEVANLLHPCYGFATGKLEGNWCNGYLP